VKRATVIELRTRTRRATQDGDTREAEVIAVQLAPFEVAICEEPDGNPAAILPAWGIEQ
jgi:hypothetical protein